MSQPLALATRRGSTDPSLLYRNPLKGSSPCFLSSMTQTETADELKRGQMEEQRALEDGDRQERPRVASACGSGSPPRGDEPQDFLACAGTPMGLS